MQKLARLTGSSYSYVLNDWPKIGPNLVSQALELQEIIKANAISNCLPRNSYNSQTKKNVVLLEMRNSSVYKQPPHWSKDLPTTLSLAHENCSGFSAPPCLHSLLHQIHIKTSVAFLLFCPSNAQHNYRVYRHGYHKFDRTEIQNFAAALIYGHVFKIC